MDSQGVQKMENSRGVTVNLIENPEVNFKKYPQQGGVQRKETS